MTIFAYQLYSSRNFPPLSQTLSMLAELGYGQVEGYGALMADEEAVASLEKGLAETGLTMPTAHVGLDLIKSDPHRVIDTAKRLNIKSIFVPYLAPDDRPTDADGWHAFGADLAEAGKPLCDAGFSYGWHNHDFEFIALPDGQMPIDLLLAHGDHVGLEFDLAWAYVAGQDPQKWVDKYGSRLSAAHIKDVAPAGENAQEDGWADVGQGVLDWGKLLASLKAHHVLSLIVEHDNPSDHRRFAERSLGALRTFDAA